jgi:hypothetical protein
MPEFVKRGFAWVNGFDFSSVIFGGAVIITIAVVVGTIILRIFRNPGPKAVPTEPPLPPEQDSTDKGKVRWPLRRKGRGTGKA